MMTKHAIVGEAVAEAVLIDQGLAEYDENAQEAVAAADAMLSPADVAHVTKEIVERATSVSTTDEGRAAVIASALEQSHAIIDDDDSRDARGFRHDFSANAALERHRRKRNASLQFVSALRLANLYSDNYYARRLDV